MRAERNARAAHLLDALAGKERGALRRDRARHADRALRVARFSVLMPSGPGRSSSARRTSTQPMRADRDAGPRADVTAVERCVELCGRAVLRARDGHVEMTVGAVHPWLSRRCRMSRASPRASSAAPGSPSSSRRAARRGPSPFARTRSRRRERAASSSSGAPRPVTRPPRTSTPPVRAAPRSRSHRSGARGGAVDVHLGSHDARHRREHDARVRRRARIGERLLLRLSRPVAGAVSRSCLRSR